MLISFKKVLEDTIKKVKLIMKMVKKEKEKKKRLFNDPDAVPYLATRSL